MMIAMDPSDRTTMSLISAMANGGGTGVKSSGAYGSVEESKQEVERFPSTLVTLDK